MIFPELDYFYNTITYFMFFWQVSSQSKKMFYIFLSDITGPLKHDGFVEGSVARTAHVKKVEDSLKW